MVLHELFGKRFDMRAANGMARSRDGFHHWQRHPDNPTFGAVEGAMGLCGNCKAQSWMGRWLPGLVQRFNQVRRKGSWQYTKDTTLAFLPKSRRVQIFVAIFHVSRPSINVLSINLDKRVGERIILISANAIRNLRSGCLTQKLYFPPIAHTT
jgi:hypothetical protein